MTPSLPKKLRFYFCSNLFMACVFYPLVFSFNMWNVFSGKLNNLPLFMQICCAAIFSGFIPFWYFQVRSLYESLSSAWCLHSIFKDISVNKKVFVMFEDKDTLNIRVYDGNLIRVLDAVKENYAEKK